MKKALLIFNVLFLSLFGINRLNAETYQLSGEFHYYSSPEFGEDWVGGSPTCTQSVCYLPFGSRTVWSLFYNTNILPDIIVGEVYDLVFTLQLSNNPSDARPLLDSISDIGISVINDRNFGTSLLSWDILSSSHSSVRIKATFKVNSVPQALNIGVSFSSGRSGDFWGYQVVQNISLELNPEYKSNKDLEDINNNITDETPPDTSEFGDVSGWLPPGPVDSILTLPLNALNSISNALNGNCTKITAPLPFIDKNLEIMCGTEFYSSVSGLSLFLNTLFTILGGVTLYKYFVYLYNWIDNIVSLKERDEKWGAV